MAKVYYKGNLLKGEATPFQRAKLAQLEGHRNFGEKISKAEASLRIDRALKNRAKANSKPKASGKVKASNKVREATLSQRKWLAIKEGKPNFGEKISFAEASKRLARLFAK